MKSSDFESLSADELWELYEQVSAILARRMAAEKARLEDRLRKIEGARNNIVPDRPRRAYPKVLPKYRNPRNPAETWSGRGKQPHWVKEQLLSGKRLHHFLIGRPAQKRR